MPAPAGGCLINRSVEGDYRSGRGGQHLGGQLKTRHAGLATRMAGIWVTSQGTKRNPTHV